MHHSISRFALLSVAAFGTLMAAQVPDNNSPAPSTQTRHQVSPDKQLSHLSRKLALSADQQNQILPILTDRQQQAAAIASDASLDQKQRRAKMKTVRSEADSKIRNILTGTQRSAYDEMQQQARERARTHRQTTAS